MVCFPWGIIIKDQYHPVHSFNISDKGYFIIVVPNSAAYFNSAAHRYGDLTHEIGFTQLNLKQALIATNFKNTVFKNFFGVGNPILNFIRTVTRWLFEVLIQILGYDRQVTYTPSLLAIVRK